MLRSLSAAAVVTLATSALKQPDFERPDLHLREGVTPLNLQTLNASFAAQYGAACLDGTPPAYWVLQQDPTKWVLFFEGGGWCWGLDDCISRAQGYLGSSAGLGSSTTVGGIVDGNSANNPAFSTWSLVFVHYCDGSSYSSNASSTTPVPPGNGGLTQIWNRGRPNMLAVLQHLMQTQGMSAAKEVIMSGGSAGGLAVYLGLDYVASILPPGTKLYGFPDAGFFLDAPAYGSNATLYRNDIISGNAVWGTTNTTSLPAACMQAYAGEEWHCLMAQYVSPFLVTPMFIMNSAYDMWQILNILNLGCFVNQNCDAPSMAAFQAYRDAQIAAVQVMLQARPYTGAYIDSCFVHEQNVDYCSGQSLPNCVGWNIFNVTAPGYPAHLTPDAAFALWYAGVSAAYPAPGENAPTHASKAAATAAAVQVVDPTQWPANPSCPWPTPAPVPAARR